MFLRRAFRYLAAGSLTTGLMVGLVTLFDRVFDFSYLIATSIAFLVTLGASYLIHTYWTFKGTQRKHARQFSQHTVLVMVNFIVNGGLMYLFVSRAGFSTPFAQLLTSGVIAIGSFLIYHLAIFSHSKTPPVVIPTYGN